MGCGCSHPFIKKNRSGAAPPLAALSASPDGLGEGVSFAEKPMGVVAIGLLVGLGLLGAAYATKYVKQR